MRHQMGMHAPACMCWRTTMGVHQATPPPCLLEHPCRLNGEEQQDKEQLQALRQLVQQLAAVNPTPQPALSPLINGRCAAAPGMR